jgi:hypothetical protein
VSELPDEIEPAETASRPVPPLRGNPFDVADGLENAEASADGRDGSPVPTGMYCVAFAPGCTDVRDTLELPQPSTGWAMDIPQVLDVARRQIAKLGLDLSGATVVAGATAGYQAVVATMAALAGARRVFAITRDLKGAAHAADATLAFARLAGVADRIELLNRFDNRRWSDVDILLACPQVGQVTRSIAELLPQRVVVSLMAAPWELRPSDIDVDACDDLGIKVAALDLGHPAVMLLPELARLGCMALVEAGVDPRLANVAVVSDTPCAPFIADALRGLRARASVFLHPDLLTADAWQAVVSAMRPSDRPPMNINGLGRIFERAPDAQFVQFSGEIDRTAAGYFGMRVWPAKKPARCQLGLSMDALGPEPVIRKVAGGLKAAEAAYRGVALGSGDIGFLVDGRAWR